MYNLGIPQNDTTLLQNYQSKPYGVLSQFGRSAVRQPPDATSAGWKPALRPKSGQYTGWGRESEAGCQEKKSSFPSDEDGWAAKSEFRTCGAQRASQQRYRQNLGVLKRDPELQLTD